MMSRTVTVFSVFLINLLSAACYAQQAKDWYSLAGASLEAYKRQGADYGSSEEEAVEKAQKNCSESAAQMSQALDQAFRTEHYNCHKDPACEQRAIDNFERREKDLFAELDVLCDAKEAEIRFHYLEKRTEQARQQYKAKVESINAHLVQLEIDEMMENAWHGLRDAVIASQENPERRTALRQQEDIRHRQRLTEINNSRAGFRYDLELSRMQLEDAFKRH